MLFITCLKLWLNKEWDKHPLIMCCGNIFCPSAVESLPPQVTIQLIQTIK